MKKAIYIVGAVAAVLLVIGFGLLILAGWGSLVEYHAFEWRGVQHKGASPLTRATGNLSYCFLGTSLLTGIITFILLFTTATKKARKAQNKHAEQNKTPLAKERDQMNP